MARRIYRPRAVIGTNIVENQNKDGSFRKLVNISFRGCYIEDIDERKNFIGSVLNAGIEKLHRNVPNTGVFRYIFRSRHLLKGSFAMQAKFCERKLNAEEIYSKVLKIINSEHTSMVFRDIVSLEICYAKNFRDLECNPAENVEIV